MLVTLTLAKRTVSVLSSALQGVLLSHIVLTLYLLPFFWINHLCVLNEKIALHYASECRKK